MNVKLTSFVTRQVIGNTRQTGQGLAIRSSLEEMPSKKPRCNVLCSVQLGLTCCTVCSSVQRAVQCAARYDVLCSVQFGATCCTVYS